MNQPYYIRVINAAGRLLQDAGVAPATLCEETLLRRARRRAGCEDFGDQQFREPLQRLLAASDATARLSSVGRLALGRYLVDLLVNRLLVQRDRDRFADIRVQRIEAPIFITGLPRTGTTLLHGLIAQDPSVRAPLAWEVMLPSPPPARATFEVDERIIAARRRLCWVHRLAPGFRRIHPLGARLPQECIAITAHAFASIQFHTTHAVASYQDWLESSDQGHAYRWHRRFLQHLQWRCPGERWVLKAPGHLFALEALLDSYPDACVVHAHRDPLAVAASIASHGVTLRRAFSDRVAAEAVAADWSRRWAAALARALAVRDAGRIPATRVLDLHYAEIVRDPLAAVARIYHSFGMTLSESAELRMRRFLAENPQDQHGRHVYSLEEFGLERSCVEARFGDYRRRFGITAEKWRPDAPE